MNIIDMFNISRTDTLEQKMVGTPRETKADSQRRRNHCDPNAAYKHQNIQRQVGDGEHSNAGTRLKDVKRIQYSSQILFYALHKLKINKHKNQGCTSAYRQVYSLQNTMYCFKDTVSKKCVF
jgi:hypothetical protein